MKKLEALVVFMFLVLCLKGAYQKPAEKRLFQECEHQRMRSMMSVPWPVQRNSVWRSKTNLERRPADYVL